MTKTVAAFMAHPDDAELCMGGTLVRFAQAGYTVHIVIACVPDFPERRRREAETGAAILGAGVRILEAPRGRPQWQVEDVPVYQLVAAFDAILVEVKPAVIFTHWQGDAHHDHVCVSKAVHSATRRQVADLFLCESPNAYAVGPSLPVDTYVDVSATMERRLQSIACHESQMRDKTFAGHVLARAAFHGERIRCQYAEAFHCVRQCLRIDQDA
jgi:LmbE family N-acetylglucosaminyl deacetylase